MNQPYQIILDIWEGNPELDVPILLANNVNGCIVRLNDMAGGHHMDTGFAKLFAMAQQFPCRAIYFVYNPWVDGLANFNWLASHLPTTYNGRIFHDIEVKYTGYSPDVYADQVAIFIDKCKARWLTTIYTCQGFMAALSHWPTTVDYWWAAYPNSMNTGEHISWDTFNVRLSALTYAYNGAVCPGGIANIKAWQCSGGGVWMPGFLTHAVDVSVFPGTLADCKKWFNSDIVVPPVPTNKQQLLEIIGELNILAGKL